MKRPDFTESLYLQEKKDEKWEDRFPITTENNLWYGCWLVENGTKPYRIVRKDIVEVYTK